MLASMMKTVAQKLLSDFENSKKISHNLAKGEAREAAIIQDFLKPYLPSRYSIERNGIVIDIKEKQSKQQDLVIFDAFFSPILQDFGAVKLFFPESVFATIEVKSLLTTEELKDVLEKSISVWELKRTIPPNLILAPGIIMPSKQVRTLCMGFCYESGLTTAEARDKLRSLQQMMPTAYALSVLCILRDKGGKCGLVVNVSPEELGNIVIIPSPASRLAIIECDSAGAALLYMYLILMEHLRGCGIVMPIPNLMEYAKVGLDSPKLQVAKEDMKGAFLSTGGKRLSTDTLQNMSEWSKKLFTQQISDDDLLDFFYYLPELPAGEVFLDPQSLFKEHGQPLPFPSTYVVYDAIKRRKEGKATSEDELLLANFVTLTRSVIAQKRSIEIGL